MESKVLFRIRKQITFTVVVFMRGKAGKIEAKPSKVIKREEGRRVRNFSPHE